MKHVNAVVKLYYPFLLSPLPPWYIARLWRPQLKAHQTNIFGSETAATYQLEPQSSHRVQVDLAFTGFPPSVFPPHPPRSLRLHAPASRTASRGKARVGAPRQPFLRLYCAQHHRAFPASMHQWQVPFPHASGSQCHSKSSVV